MAHPGHEVRVDESVADDGRQSDAAAAAGHEVVHGLAEDLVRHELDLALLVLVGAEDAVGIAEVGELEVELIGPQGHGVQRLVEVEEPPDEAVRLAPQDARGLGEEHAAGSSHEPGLQLAGRAAGSPAATMNWMSWGSVTRGRSEGSTGPYPAG